jgi:taurine dioxygenase
MGFDVRKLSGALGARISGLDFKAGLAPADLSAIADALAVHQVLVIDAAEMAPGQQVQIARLFGEPEHHVFFPNLGPGLEHVTVLDSEAGQRSDRWHIDEVFLEHPPCVTTLHAQILPSFGGDTAFVSMAAAYDALSPRMKAYIEGLEAIFDYAKIAELSWVRGTGGADKLSQFAGQMRWAAHPIVRAHPMTGRKALYIEATYLRHIAGLPEGERQGPGRLPAGPHAAAGVRLPPPVAARRLPPVGQPQRHALRDRRLHRAPPHVPCLGDAPRRSDRGPRGRLRGLRSSDELGAGASGPECDVREIHGACNPGAPSSPQGRAE